MAKQSSGPIARANFGRRWLIILIIGGIGLLCLAAGISFLFQGPEAAEIAHYPIISGLVFLAPAIAIFLLQGRFWLDESHFHFKRRIGKQQDIPLTNIAKVGISGMAPGPSMSVALAQGGTRHFRDIGPSRMPGVVWAFLNYSAVIPQELLKDLSRKRRSAAVPEVKTRFRNFVRNGKIELQDHGPSVQVGEMVYYVPASTTQSPGSMVGMMMPVSFTSYLKTPNVPDREHLPIEAVVQDITTSSHNEAEKARMLRHLVQLHNGSEIHQDQKNSDGRLYEPVDKELRLVLT